VFQAASDTVLSAMRREYTCKEFEQVVDTLLANVPGMTIATDVICGFPGETAEDFELTLDLIRKYCFPVVNISQFYPRPGTAAARMRRVPTSEVKRRSRALTTLFESYRTNNDRLGQVQRVLITEIARDGKSLVGHNKSYQQVLISASKEKYMGTSVNVRIVECGKYFVRGELLPVEGPTLRSPQFDAYLEALKPRPSVKRPPRPFVSRSASTSTSATSSPARSSAISASSSNASPQSSSSTPPSSASALPAAPSSASRPAPKDSHGGEIIQGAPASSRLLSWSGIPEGIILVSLLLLLFAYLMER
jgi:TRAM domain